MDRLHEELKVPIVEITKEPTGSSEEDMSPRNGKGLLGGNASADGKLFIRPSILEVFLGSLA